MTQPDNQAENEYNPKMEQSSPTRVDDPAFVPVCAIFRRFLKRQGLKFTTERALILDAVLGQTAVFEAEALLEEMRTSELRVSKATIYRTLRHLVDAKIINEVLLDSRQAHYELSFGKEPKGHLVCVETGDVEEFPTPSLQQLVDEVCAERGYDPVSFRFVIYGISPKGKEQAGEDEV